MGRKKSSSSAPTIQDVAHMSGVSTATVSRVFSGKNSVKKETRDLVMKCAAELGYHYSLASSVQDCKIMIIVSDITNSFYISIIQGISEILAGPDFKTAIFQTNGVVYLEEEYARFAQRDHFSGIIMITAIETPDLISILKQNSCPTVLVNRYIRSLDLNSVCIDNFSGGYRATKYLIDRGHKKIAHLAGPATSTASSDRLRGYIAALRDEGCPMEDSAIFPGDLSGDSGWEFAEYFLHNLKDYSAVFCANDIMAATFMSAMEAHGYHVPEDVSIICFDDTPAALSGSTKLTTVSRNGNTMGQAAAEIMLDILRSPNHPSKKVVYPPVLNERDSVRNLAE